MAKVKAFDKNNLQLFRKEFETAVKSLETKFGIAINLKGITYNDRDFNAKLHVMITDPANPKMDPRVLEYRNNVTKHGWKFEMKPQHIGLMATLGKYGKCTLIGCASRYKKHPLVFQTMDGNLINASTEWLRKAK